MSKKDYTKYSQDVENKIRYIRELQEEYKTKPTEDLKKKIQIKIEEIW